jgi:hypothetical protein
MKDVEKVYRKTKRNESETAVERIRFLNHFVELCEFYEVAPAIAFESPIVRQAVKRRSVTEVIEALATEF